MNTWLNKFQIATPNEKGLVLIFNETDVLRNECCFWLAIFLPRDLEWVRSVVIFAINPDNQGNLKLAGRHLKGRFSKEVIGQKAGYINIPIITVYYAIAQEKESKVRRWRSLNIQHFHFDCLLELVKPHNV